MQYGIRESWREFLLRISDAVAFGFVFSAPLLGGDGWAIVPFDNPQPIFDYGNAFTGRKLGGVKTKWQILRRSLLWVLPLETFFAVVLGIAKTHPALLSRLMPLTILGVLLNLPGFFVARALNLFGRGGFNPPPDPHPIAGTVVALGVGATCWVLLLCRVQQAKQSAA